MKYYKIYSHAVRNPRPVQDVTFKKQEVLDEAIQWNYDMLFESNGTHIDDDEVKRLYALTLEDDVDDDVYNKLYEAAADYLTRWFEKVESLSAGDWGIVALEDDEDAWEHRPNVW